MRPGHLRFPPACIELEDRVTPAVHIWDDGRQRYPAAGHRHGGLGPVVQHHGRGRGGDDSARLVLTGTFEIPVAATVRVESDGLLSLNGGARTEDFTNLSLGAGAKVTIGGGSVLEIQTTGTISATAPVANITGAGSLRLEGGVVTVDVADGTNAFGVRDFEIEVPVVGSGGLRKTGTGRLALDAAANTYTGTTFVDDGILFLEGDEPVALTRAGTTLYVLGAEGNDVFGVQVGSPRHEVTLNNVDLHLDPAAVSMIGMYMYGGTDTIALVTTGAIPAAFSVLYPGGGYVQAAGVFACGDAENATACGRPVDTAYLLDSPGTDTYVGTPTVTMTGEGYSNGAVGFGTYGANSSGGGDGAYLNGGAGTETFTTSSTYGVMQGTGYYQSVIGFSGVIAIGNGGGDAVFL